MAQYMVINEHDHEQCAAIKIFLTWLREHRQGSGGRLVLKGTPRRPSLLGLSTRSLLVRPPKGSYQKGTVPPAGFEPKGRSSTLILAATYALT